MADKRTKVFFDLNMGGKDLGKVTFELYNDIVPKTAENFKVLCTREKPEGFKNSSFHRIIKSNKIIYIQTLWLKEEISQLATVLEVNQSTEKSLLTKTSKSNTLNLIFCQWQMPAKIPMDHNSSLHSYHAIGLMVNTSYLDKLLMEKALLMLSMPMQHQVMANLELQLLLLTVELFNDYSLK